MIHKKTISIICNTREDYREKLILNFLKEQSGTRYDASEYYYYVDKLSTGERIYLKRPTSLNKGMDFEVRVENINFRYGKYGNVISTGNRPSHDDIINDLMSKKKDKPILFKQLINLLDKTYNCNTISDQEFAQFNFSSGFSVELIFKVLKWLFIEQDITYWNRSGREMLYKGINELWDN